MLKINFYNNQIIFVKKEGKFLIDSKKCIPTYQINKLRYFSKFEMMYINEALQKLTIKDMERVVDSLVKSPLYIYIRWNYRGE